MVTPHKWFETLPSNSVKHQKHIDKLLVDLKLRNPNFKQPK